VESARATAAVTGPRPEVLPAAVDFFLILKNNQRLAYGRTVLVCCERAPEVVTYAADMACGRIEGASHRDRLAASRLVLEVAGILGQGPQQASADRAREDKPLNEWTISELQGFIAQAARETAGATVEGAAEVVEADRAQAAARARKREPTADGSE
jgi:hypothetical protein